ncbi:hypothetical protein [Streptomyces albidoflavus]|uniref:hypothetical protein n=1 Tax=Streptomyces albidoflavus TaxID=1886 RepID=UPI00101F7A71|nr:hypothetical protein [Streptomyces albidoflavus]RZD70682.1 hypothetical protein C0Q61_30780 [Streptomyces albidoflavus]
MTESTTPLSGVDLARVALHNAREAAKQQGASPRRRSTAIRTTRRTGGREPVSFGEAVQQLIADRAWKAPVAAGGVLDRWSHIADDLAGRVTAVKYDADTATLTLQPDSSTASPRRPAAERPSASWKSSAPAAGRRHAPPDLIR